MVDSSHPSCSIIYEDDEIRVIWSPGIGDLVVVTFGDLVTMAQGWRFFADKPLKKMDIPAIGVMPKGAFWYQGEGLCKAYPKILEKTSRFSARILYGGSMGGYAALKFSCLLAATHVLAMCPQWSIDPADWEGEDAGWQSYFRPFMRGMGISAGDVAGRLYLFADLFNPQDHRHLDKIKENIGRTPTKTIINVPFVGHDVTIAFASTLTLKGLVEACLQEDVAALHRFSRERRKALPAYRATLRKALLRRRAPVFARVFLKYERLASRIFQLVDIWSNLRSRRREIRQYFRGKP